MVSSITLLVLYGLFVVWTCLLRPVGLVHRSVPWRPNSVDRHSSLGRSVPPTQLARTRVTETLDFPMRAKGSAWARIRTSAAS